MLFLSKINSWIVLKGGGIFISEKIYSEVKPGKKRFKTALAKIILFFLGRGFKVCASMDSRIKHEVGCLDDGMTIMMRVDPNGPCMAVRKISGKLEYIGSSCLDDADMSIYFKNIEAAILVLTGQIGIAQAYAEHRFTLKGDIALGMSVVRCMNIIEAYLFPKFISRKILKKVPEKEVSTARIYISIIF